MHIKWGITGNYIYKYTFLIPQLCHYWFIAVFEHIFHSSQSFEQLAAHMGKRQEQALWLLQSKCIIHLVIFHAILS